MIVIFLLFREFFQRDIMSKENPIYDEKNIVPDSNAKVNLSKNLLPRKLNRSTWILLILKHTIPTTTVD